MLDDPLRTFGILPWFHFPKYHLPLSTVLHTLSHTRFYRGSVSMLVYAVTVNVGFHHVEWTSNTAYKVCWDINSVHILSTQPPERYSLTSWSRCSIDQDSDKCGDKAALFSSATRYFLNAGSGRLGFKSCHLFFFPIELCRILHLRLGLWSHQSKQK